MLGQKGILCPYLIKILKGISGSMMCEEAASSEELMCHINRDIMGEEESNDLL